MEGKTPRELALAGTDGGMHARLAQGLREAADFLLAHPDLPVPDRVEISYYVPAVTDRDGEDELTRIAAMIGSHVTGDAVSRTGRDFGPSVRYAAEYVTRAFTEAYQEHMAPFYVAQSAAKQEGPVAA